MDVNVGVGVCVLVMVCVGVGIAAAVFDGATVDVEAGSLVDVNACSSAKASVGLERTSLSALHPGEAITKQMDNRILILVESIFCDIYVSLIDHNPVFQPD